MTTLRSYNHDFARLAKQSGYYFQLHRGKVNWSELQKLNVEEIVENRNFELLEQNLINVINCNLEMQYDFKVLDQNFVKLFKLAQLGIDYLSYCQLYLDKCVILLQEKLTASQEKCEILKKENLRKNEELQEAKSRVKARNYQCEKCDKVFISEVYLKCHDKRRHGDLSTPIRTKTTKNFVDKLQQTDEENRKLSKSVQTVSSQNDTKESEEINKLKEENHLKIDNLEKEVDDLKNRLRKAENTLIEKTEVSCSNSHNLNFPGPLYYPSMLPFIPTYLPQPYFEINSGHLAPTPELKQSYSPIVPQSVDIEVVSSNKSSIFSYPCFEKEKDIVVTSQKDVSKEREIKAVETVSGNIVECETNTTKQQKNFINHKENIDPNELACDVNRAKPRPLPRKIKNMFQTAVPDKTLVEAIDIVDSNIYLESDVVNFSSQSIPRSSTPKIEPEETSKETLRTEKDINSNESLLSQETVSTEPKPKSFIKKIVTRNSPKLQELSKNLKRSLTNLYDSVSSSGRDMGKAKDVSSSNSKMNTIDALNAQLRELGIDPEWSGIPKKTMKEKLEALKFQRKLLTKENPKYPDVRRKLEKSILRKLNKNFINLRMKKGAPESNEQESIETQSSDAIKVFDTHNNSLMSEQKLENEVMLIKPIMYNTETSSDTDVSDIETPPKPIQRTEKVTIEKEIGSDLDLEDFETDKPEEVEKEFDFSIFQVNKEDSSKLVTENNILQNEIDELDTDSDFNEEFLKKFESSCLKMNATKIEDNISEELEAINKDQLNFIEIDQDKTENQSILKSSQKFHSQPSFTLKKKVLFADYPENSEKSNSIKEFQSKIKKKDEIWSSESDWDEDMS